jgi:hypothetical protein
VASWFNRVYVKYDDPVFLSVDFSKYDMTQGADAIEIELQFYEKIGLNRCSVNAKYDFPWSKLRDIKMNADRLSRWGHRVSGPGQRKTGDLDTSIGNTLMTVRITTSWLNRHGLKYHIAVLGDDNLTVLESRSVLLAFGSFENARLSYLRWCQKLGIEAKAKFDVEPIRAEFLSKRFYHTEQGYVFGVKPGRWLRKIGWTLSRATNEVSFQSICKGTLASFGTSMTAVPFARVYGRVILWWLKDVTAAVVSTEYQLLASQGDVVLDPLGMEQFVGLYGLDSLDERNFEREMLSMLSSESVFVPVLYDSEYVNRLCEVDDNNF